MPGAILKTYITTMKTPSIHLAYVPTLPHYLWGFALWQLTFKRLHFFAISVYPVKRCGLVTWFMQSAGIVVEVWSLAPVISIWSFGYCRWTTITQHNIGVIGGTVYPKKYAHGFVVLCFAVVMQSFIMNSHEVFIHIYQGCFAGTGAIVRLPQCQWSKPDGYGKISQCLTTTKHSKAKTVCIFLGIYCNFSTPYLNHALFCFELRSMVAYFINPFSIIIRRLYKNCRQICTTKTQGPMYECSRGFAFFVFHGWYVSVRFVCVCMCEYGCPELHWPYFT